MEELFVELVLTLSFSFIFTFLITKLIFADYSSSSIHDLDDDDDLIRDDRIRKLTLDEPYFDPKKTNNHNKNKKFLFPEELIKVHQLSILDDDAVEIEDHQRRLELSDEFGSGDLCSSELSSDVSSGRGADLEESAAEFSGRSCTDDDDGEDGDGDNSVDHDSVVEKSISDSINRAMICGIEIDFTEARPVDRGDHHHHHRESFDQFDDDWEAIDRKDFEETIDHDQGMMVLGNDDKKVRYEDGVTCFY